MGRMPLEGVLVVDFGHVLAGPYGTKQLRTLGATVIKMESRGHFDNFRPSYMRKGVKDFAKEGGWTFQENATGKLCLSINTKSPAGQEIIHKLVKKADVVTANLSPDGYHKMGIDYETLSKVKEDIIVLNASGMGETGVYRKYKTAAPIMQALSGFSSFIGYDGEEPFGFAAVFADYVGGAYIAAAVTSALEYRRRTGKGQFIDLSSTEGTVCTLGSNFMRDNVTGVETRPFGNRHYLNRMAPHGCYPTNKADNWVVIAVGDEEEWKRFQNELRAECPWVDDGKYATLEGRLANMKELDANIAAWTGKYDKTDIAYRLQAAGVSSSMVLNGAEFPENEHALANGFIHAIDLGDDGLQPRFCKITGRLLNIQGMPEIEYTHGPGIGEHNEYVLKELLGMTDAEIQTAAEAGAFA